MPNHGKRATRRVTAALAVAAVTGAIAVFPAQADPDTADVAAKVDALYQQAAQAQERFNEARLKLERMNGEVASLSSDEKRQDRRLASVREQVRDSVVRQYQGEGIGTVGQVVVSDDPTRFLNRLSTLQAFNDMQADLLADFTAEVEALDLRQEVTRERRKEIRATTAVLAKEQAQVEKKLDEAEQVLSRLTGRERARLAPVSRDTVRLPDVKVSGRAKDAVAAALAQVNDRYVHGASGMDAYDCSGLTMMAWGQAGVALPHSSSMQYAQGRKVDRADLRPGDLVFYYTPISHVGMYIGNGKIVDAANPRTGVRVTNVFSMPYVGAVRPG